MSEAQHRGYAHGDRFARIRPSNRQARTAWTAPSADLPVKLRVKPTGTDAAELRYRRVGTGSPASLTSLSSRALAGIRGPADDGALRSQIQCAVVGGHGGGDHVAGTEVVGIPLLSTDEDPPFDVVR